MSLAQAPEVDREKSVGPAGEWRTNPDLIVFQGRLLAPAVQSSGKWVVFDPNTKRSFAAAGKEEMPPLLALLADGAGRGKPDVDSPQFDHLVQAGLFVPRSDRAATDNDNAAAEYLRRYHLATYNYEFRDYALSDWREKDRRLMAQYAKLWDPPPKHTSRSGDHHLLPAGDLGSLDSAHATEIEQVATILRFALGSFGLIPGDFGPWFHKTSPSGGAKHPTEAEITLDTDLGPVPAGTYDYDHVAHALVRRDEPTAIVEDADESSITIVLKARVERPMWRYRDIRSYRAVMIDAGHVAETLILLAGAAGLATRLGRSLSLTPSMSWTDEPPMASVSIRRAGAPVPRRPSARPPAPVASSEVGATATFITNPTLHFTFGTEGLLAASLWPHPRSAPVTDSDVIALTHALPSRRGDRDVTVAGIAAASGLVEPAVEALIEQKFLLPTQMGWPAYRRLHTWVQHSWYMVFLAIAASRGLPRAHSPVEGERVHRIPALADNATLGAALMARKTTRAFAEDEPIADDAFRALICTAAAAVSRELEVFVTIRYAIDGVEPALYAIRSDGSLVRRGQHLPTTQLQSIVTGQKPAVTGSLIFWFVATIGFSVAGEFEDHLVQLGRHGQDICLIATHNSLGVFTTPATRDDLAYAYLGIGDPESRAAYVVTVGRPR